MHAAFIGKLLMYSSGTFHVGHWFHGVIYETTKMHIKYHEKGIHRIGETDALQRGIPKANQTTETNNRNPPFYDTTISSRAASPLVTGLTQSVN
jgi:hypothetical protein